jgi:type IV pilus assembly protein PilA
MCSHRLFPLASLFLWGMAAIAQTSPEEQVLLDMFFAKNAATVENHFPEAVRKVLRELKPEDRAEFEKVIMIRNQLCERSKCSVPGDGHALLAVEREGESGPEVVEVKLHRRLSDGRESVLQFETATSERSVESFQIWMSVEEGVWRITEIRGPYGQKVILDKEFAERFVHARLNSNESSAVGNIRTLNTSLVTYASTYSDIGFATSLGALGGEGGSPNHAGLIDAVLASAEKSGYRFSLRGESNEYEIVARPIRFGETGTKSFFTDQSGVIRFTEENRAATASDQPLQ